MGDDFKLRAFHNVCRHRAYTVVRRTCGSSLRFSCKYHGWQYNSQGALVKAPQFEKIPGFKPEENGLFEVSLAVDRRGFIFVNFDPAAASPHHLTREFPSGFRNWKVVGEWIQSARCQWAKLRQLKLSDGRLSRRKWAS